MVECCDNSGGRVVLTINGRRYRSRATVTIRPTRIAREVEANNDGSIYVTTRARPAQAEFTLSDQCGLRLEDLLDHCFVDATVDLIDMRRKYLFTKATVVGEPEIASDTGEIRGLSIASGLVKQFDY